MILAFFLPREHTIFYLTSISQICFLIYNSVHDGKGPFGPPVNNCLPILCLLTLGECFNTCIHPAIESHTTLTTSFMLLSHKVEWLNCGFKILFPMRSWHPAAEKSL